MGLMQNIIKVGSIKHVLFRLQVGNETAAHACVVPAWEALDSCRHKSAAILGDQRHSVEHKDRFLLRFHAGAS